ncbi:MAG: sulfotransferase family 2 domain-containing protein [Phycisphaerales bacterium]
MLGVPVFPRIARTLEHPAGHIRPASPVAFHHIPKTAGSTFRRILEQLFEPDEVCPAEVDAELPDDLHATRWRLFAGHFSFTRLMQLPGHTVRLTFVRDPIQRIISDYYNIVSEDRLPRLWRQRIEADPSALRRQQVYTALTLEEYLTSTDPSVFDRTINRQVRYLAGTDAAPAAFVTDGWDLDRLAGVLRDDPNLRAPALLEAAKRNLVERFAFVGVQEDFDLSLSVFATTFGLRPFRNADEFNANLNPVRRDFRPYEISDELRAQLEKDNALDFELWRFARKLLRERAQRFAEQAEREAGQERTSGTGGRCPGPVLPLRIGAEQLHAPRGFHRVERDGLGRPFRWTGWEPDAVIEFAAEAAAGVEVEIHMHVLSAMTPEALSRLSVRLDGHPARLLRENRDESGIVLTFVAPMGKCRTHELELTGPRELEPQTDSGRRRLGVALHAVELRPAAAGGQEEGADLCSSSTAQPGEERP